MTKEEILELREKRAKALNLTICPECGYCNQRFNIEKYGDCTCCGYVLDKKAKMFYEIKKKNKYKKCNK